MKRTLARVALTLLASLPMASVATAAQNKLQAMDDHELVDRLGETSVEEGSSVTSDAIIEELTKRGLLETNVEEMDPPSPSVHV